MPKATPEMAKAIDELPKKGVYMRRIWWALVWRIVLWLVIFMGMVIVVTNHWLINYPFLRYAIQTGSALAVLPLGYVALHQVVNRPFKGFRLALLSTEVAPPVEGNVAAQNTNPQKTDTKTGE